MEFNEELPDGNHAKSAVATLTDVVDTVYAEYGEKGKQEKKDSEAREKREDYAAQEYDGNASGGSVYSSTAAPYDNGKKGGCECCQNLASEWKYHC